MKRRKRGWFALIGLSIAAVFIVWLLAFLLWLSWPNLSELLWPEGVKTAPGTDQRPGGEQIYEEERKQLEEILKRKP
jgi:hypothetical protein